MKNISILVFVSAFMSLSLSGQVSNINISGSYQGVFTLSGTEQEYKVAGSPYLTESWMFGTLELKKILLGDASEQNKTEAQIRNYTEKIKQCEELIQKFSDPDFKTIGLTLSRAKADYVGGDPEADIEISDRDFSELSGLIENFEGNLLAYLTKLKAEYQAELTEINQIKGLFRYNLYAQEFEMIYEADTFAIMSPLDVKSISLSNKRFIYGFYVEKEFGNDYLGSSYFEVLNEGACKLLLRHEVKIKNHSGPVTYGWAGSESDAFVKIKQLYFQKSDDMEVVLMKKNKKFLKRVFAEKYYEIERFIKDEKINLKDEKDLISVFDYYNNLES